MSTQQEAYKALADRIEHSELQSRIAGANLDAAECLIKADPVWVDILPAGEVIKGLGDYTVTHSGPRSTSGI